MRRALGPALLVAIVVVAARGAGAGEGGRSFPAARAMTRPLHADCGYSNPSAIHQRGGVQRVPHVADADEFAGEFGYAPFAWNGPVQALIESCPPSDPLALVPSGYTPDWFGLWALSCTQGCSGLTFDRASLTGSLRSSAWLAGTTYYMYVYDDASRQLIESYPIGPIKALGHRMLSLEFASPFENGFTYQSDDEIALEIVHQAP